MKTKLSMNRFRNAFLMAGRVCFSPGVICRGTLFLSGHLPSRINQDNHRVIKKNKDHKKKRKRRWNMAGLGCPRWLSPGRSVSVRVSYARRQVPFPEGGRPANVTANCRWRHRTPAKCHSFDQRISGDNPAGGNPTGPARREKAPPGESASFYR